MTRVLHVFGAMDIGGAELRTLELMAALRDFDVSFEFLALSGRQGRLAAEVAELGGVVHPLPLDVRFPMRYFKLLRRSRPDAVDSHVATFSGVLLAGAWMAGVPRRIAHFRSDGDGHPNTHRRRLQRALMVQLIKRFATHIVGVSPSALAHGYDARWQRDRRARVIPNGLPPHIAGRGVDLRRELNIGTQPRIALCVGRSSPEKNRVWAVRVAHAVRQRGFDLHLAFIGDYGVDTEPIRRVTAELGEVGKVHDLGARRSVREYMGQADVLIVSSRREGLPGVVLEAISMGTPVVGSDLPGVRFIQDFLPGVVTVSLDEPPSVWAESVIQVLERFNYSTREEMRTLFSESIYSQSHALDAHLSMYRRAPW